jgi:hypothetical protein
VVQVPLDRAVRVGPVRERLAGVPISPARIHGTAGPKRAISLRRGPTVCCSVRLVPAGW